MRNVIADLAALRRRFDPAAERARTSLLRRAAAVALSRIDPADLLAYHEELLFLAAYPPSRRVLAAAEEELRRVAAATTQPAYRAALAESGIANTPVEHAFTAEMLAWLTRRPVRSLDLAWHDGSAGPALDTLLAALATPLEADGLDEPDCSTRRWLALAAGGGGRAAVRWLADRLLSLPGPLAARDQLVDGLDLRVRFTPRPHDSRTFIRFPRRPLFVQAEPLLRDPDLGALCAAPLPAGRSAPLPLRAAQRVIDTARATLCIRQRETDPVTYANPREVWLLPLERGLDVAVIGMLPQRRLPLDSYFGFVAARNRVPLAYGGGWMFFDRCEIGINLFDTFRGGESAYLFTQVLRVYRRLFHVGYFQVDPFQFGADNDEAIRSGAFWFYHRLGFRPRQPALQRLAADESARIEREPGYRSPPRTLRRLARSQLVLRAADPNARRPAAPAPDPRRIGLALTRYLGRRFAGDRARAEALCVREVTGALCTGDVDRWPRSARAALQRFAPLCAMIGDLPRWSADDKVRLTRVIRAKAGRGERGFVLALQRAGRLRAALADIARSGR